MNRREILDCLNRFPYDRGEYWVLTGSAMVLYGIRELTADIDLGCSTRLADQLEAEGFPYRRTEDGNRWFKYGNSIEVFENWLFDTGESVEDYPVISIQGLIRMKQKLGREKDWRDIEQIQAWMKRTNLRLCVQM